MFIIGLGMTVVISLIVLGIPIFYSFFTAVFLLVAVTGDNPSFLLSFGYDAVSAVVMLCVPLYVCVGSMMQKSDIGSALVDFVGLFVGRVRGGLGVVAVFTCAVFGSISGSSTATLSCIGSVMLPRMYERGYPRGLSTALLANACPLGLLIPPSMSMIVYAWVSKQSILACFLATVLPGIFLAIMLSATTLFLLRNDQNIKLEDKLPKGQYLPNFCKKTFISIPAILMPIVILGGTYSGVFTPTESAAIAVFYALPVGFFIYKKLTLKSLYETFVETASTTGVVLVMIFAIMILSRILVMQNLPEIITEFLAGISTNPKVILLFVNIILLILGMIMDDMSAMLLSVPILAPVCMHFGVHPIHLAAIVGVNLGLGIITPPCAPMLYLGARVGNVPVLEMLGPTIKFIIFAWLPTLIAVTYFPELSLWFPRLVLGQI